MEPNGPVGIQFPASELPHPHSFFPLSLALGTTKLQASNLFHNASTISLNAEDGEACPIFLKKCYTIHL